MKHQAYNPYLPGWEYIPDGEPKNFNGRIYLYGSHDAANGKRFCPNDYVCWSAPETDLSDWRYEGVIYRREKVPHEGDQVPDLWAPDVVRGVDGRYYLYYSIANSSRVSVAVCDEPAGEYRYLGDVHRADGHVVGTGKDEPFEFDPAVLVDTDGRVWLYSGSGQKSNGRYGHPIVGCFVRELEQDMITAKSEARVLLPADWSIKKPGFFEGASIRHIGELYYLIYPATDMTGLNYATSRFPDRDFVHRGLIHSTSDIGLPGIGMMSPRYPLGNNHGSIVQADGKWYVFDHRMTNRNMFSRQGVAERIEISKDGAIVMVEATSCGLNGGPLTAEGTYPAYIACNLFTRSRFNPAGLIGSPYIKQDEDDYDPDHPQGEPPVPYVAGMTSKGIVGYKYFRFKEPKRLTVLVRGRAKGHLEVRDSVEGQPVLSISVEAHEQWASVSGELPLAGKTAALYFRFRGRGKLSMKEFSFE